MITDILGRIPQVGDTILTKGYGSSEMSQQATVLKVNDKTIGVEVYRTRWKLDSSGKWVRYKDTSRPPKKLRRANQDFIIINEQLTYNMQQWPELYV